MMKKILLPLLILSSIGVSLALGVSISPARYEMTADKGNTVYGEFSVTNQSDTDQVYVTSIENFTAQGETGIPLFTKDNKDIASWLLVDKKITVAKGEKKTVTFSLSVPDGAEAGGHFGAIFLYSDPGEGNGVNVSIGTKVGMLILLKVNGDIKLGADIKDFSANSPSDTDLKAKTFFTDLPLNLSYRFTNSGNDRVNPYGVVSITNTVGMKTETLSANPNQGNVLPQSTRKFDITWGNGDKEAIPTGFFARALYQFSHFALGYYTADLKIAYDVTAKKDGTETIDDIFKNVNSSSAIAEKTLKVFILPWQFLIVFLASLTLLFIILTAGLKRYNKWIIKQAKLNTHK